MQSQVWRHLLTGYSSSSVFTSDSSSVKGSLRPLQSLLVTSVLLLGLAHHLNLPHPQEQLQGLDAAEANHRVNAWQQR